MNDKLKINESYAKNYDKWRSKEELQKLKARYGDVKECETSSSDETDEDLGDYINEDFEERWLKTLNAIKCKDPEIYDPNVKFFEVIDKTSTKLSEKKEKMTLKDYDRQVMLERKGKYSDSDGESEIEKNRIPSYSDEQKCLKRLIKDVIADDSSDEDEDFFRKKEDTCKGKGNTEESFSNEEDEYISNIQRKSSSAIKQTINKRDAPDKEEFLQKYLLSDKWREVDDTGISYLSNEDLSEEEEQLEKEEKFERKYNFRHEEPNSIAITSFPREVEDSMRETKFKRKEKRIKTKEKRAAEKEKKKQELKQLSKLKKKDIEEKILRLTKTAGFKDDQKTFHGDDLESDFDEEKYDAKMKNLFDDQFYKVDDNEKPIFEMSENSENEDWNNYVVKTENRKKDISKNIEKSKKSKKKASKVRFRDIIEKSKPLFDPEDKNFDEYAKEYYSLDFEDVVGDLPCRFKYRETVKNNFGLEIDDILKASDSDLNKWVGVRRMSQYRSEKDEKYDIKKYKHKASDPKKKLSIIPSLSTEIEESGKDEKKLSKTLKRRIRKKKTLLGQQSSKIEKNIVNSSKLENSKNEEDKNAKIKARKKKAIENRKRKGLSDDRLAAYGLDVKKMKYNK